MFRLEKRLKHFPNPYFFNLNITKNRVGLQSQLENYLSEIIKKWTENWLENFLCLEIK